MRGVDPTPGDRRTNGLGLAVGVVFTVFMAALAVLEWWL